MIPWLRLRAEVSESTLRKNPLLPSNPWAGFRVTDDRQKTFLLFSAEYKNNRPVTRTRGEWPERPVLLHEPAGGLSGSGCDRAGGSLHVSERRFERESHGHCRGALRFGMHHCDSGPFAARRLLPGALPRQQQSRGGADTGASRGNSVVTAVPLDKPRTSECRASYEGCRHSPRQTGPNAAGPPGNRWL